MKKIISIFLLLSLCLSLCSCKSKESQNVEAMINSIGQVTANSGDLITRCRTAYDALTEKDKNNVDNYSVLIAAELMYQKVAPVILTTENISQYLTLSFEHQQVGDLWYMLYLYSVDGELTLKTNAMAHGHFEDVQITVKIELNNEDWHADNDDSGYREEDPDNLYVTLRLPTSGEYTETHNISGTEMYSEPSNLKVGQITYSFEEVSGKFYPAG